MDNISIKEKDVIYNNAMCTMTVVQITVPSRAVPKVLHFSHIMTHTRHVMAHIS